MNKHTTASQKTIMLEQLRRHGNKTRAARAAKTTRQTLNRLIKTDPMFRAAVKVAMKEGLA